MAGNLPGTAMSLRVLGLILAVICACHLASAESMTDSRRTQSHLGRPQDNSAETQSESRSKFVSLGLASQSKHQAQARPSIDLSASRQQGVSAREVHRRHSAFSSLEVDDSNTRMHSLEEEEPGEKEKEQRQEEEKKQEEEKVRSGVEVMSEEEQSTTILRCMQEDEVLEPKDVVAPNVSIGLYVINLGSTDGLVSGVYFAEFLLYLGQEGSPLADFDGEDPIDQLAFSNAKSIGSIKPYGPGTYMVSGEFFFSPDLRWYPFDQQDLRIVTEQMETPVTEWDFVPSNANGLSPSVRFPGWLSSLHTTKSATKAPCRTRSGVKVYPGGSRADPESMNNVTYSKFTYTLTLERPIMQGLLTHILPPIVVFLPTLYSYGLAPVKDALTKMSLSGGGMISLIFIWRGISGSLPAMNYLTAFDKYIFCFFVLISVALTFAIGCYSYFAQDFESESPRDLREMLSDLSSKVCWFSVGFIFLVFLPLWMFIDQVIILPLGLLGLVVGCLWCWNEFEEIKLSYEPQELSGLQPNDVKLED